MLEVHILKRLLLFGLFFCFWTTIRMALQKPWNLRNCLTRNYHMWKQKIMFVLGLCHLDYCEEDDLFGWNSDRPETKKWGHEITKHGNQLGLALQWNLEHMRDTWCAKQMWNAVKSKIVFKYDTVLNQLAAPKKFSLLLWKTERIFYIYKWFEAFFPLTTVHTNGSRWEVNYPGCTDFLSDLRTSSWVWKHWKR